MKVFLQRFSYLLLIVVVSHLLDDIAIQYGNKQVAGYVFSERNPSRHLYSNKGEIVKRELDESDDKAVTVAAESIERIKRKTVMLRLGQQILLCFIFAFFVFWGRKNK